jgi:hypothetical protein
MSEASPSFLSLSSISQLLIFPLGFYTGPSSILPLLCTSGSQSMGYGTGASKSPENLLEMQIAESYPYLLDQEL